MACRTEEFAFPLARDDFIKGLTESKRLLSVQEIVAKVHDCQVMFVDIGPSYIEECFSDVLSVIHHFSNLSASIRNLYWNMILEALNDSCQLVESTDTSAIVKRNSLKMLVYIISQFIELFENQESKSINVVKKKSRKSARETGGGTTSSANKFSLCESQRNRVLVVLYDVIQLNLRQVFVPPTYDGLEDMINIVSGCCFKLLENTACTKDGHFKDSVANLLGLIVKSYHQNLGVSVKMVQLLQHFDHLIQPLAYSVHIMVTKHNLDTFVDDILREIGEKDQQDLSMDTSGTKSYASFIYEIAHLLPFHAKNCTQYLLPHLNGESHTLRCWILSAFGEIISQALNGSDISPEDRELRDVLLTSLQKHIHDVSAFVRSKALQVWQILCEAKSVPLSQLKDLCVIVSGRIKDKSSLVRKCALQLMVCLMKTNPFASNVRNFP